MNLARERGTRKSSSYSICFYLAYDMTWPNNICVLSRFTRAHRIVGRTLNNSFRIFRNDIWCVRIRTFAREKKKTTSFFTWTLFANAVHCIALKCDAVPSFDPNPRVKRRTKRITLGVCVSSSFFFIFFAISICFLPFLRYVQASLPVAYVTLSA